MGALPAVAGRPHPEPAEGRGRLALGHAPWLSRASFDEHRTRAPGYRWVAFPTRVILGSRLEIA